MTRVSRTLAPLAVVFAATLALAGCMAPAPGTDTGGDPPATETETGGDTGFSTPAATGELITGTGYSYNVPEGWGIPGGVDNPQLDSVAADLTDDDGFADNINVLLSPAGSLTSDQVESAGVAELEQFGATDISVEDRVTIAGAESAHLSALFTSQGLTYRVHQFYPTEGGQTFVVTFSYSETLPEADRITVAESVLASWTWS